MPPRKKAPAKRRAAQKPTRKRAARKPSKTLRWAAQLGETEQVKTLLAKGADPDEVDTSSTPLCMACFHRKVPIVRLLLAAGANPSLHAPTDSAPLVYAVTSGSKRTLEMVRMLLDAGAEPNPAAYRGMTLIEWCGRNPALADVRELLESRVAAGS